MKKQSLFQGALVLTISAFITKLLGFAITIIQSRILGAEGIGLQMMVMPVMGLMMTLTTLGLPVAISKAIAEADSKGDLPRIKRILFISLSITGSLSLVLFIVMSYFSKIFAFHFLADQRSYYSFIALLPVIPILAIQGVLRGYFRGRQNMNPIAIAQVIEQIARIGLLIFLVRLLIPYGIEYAAAGAIIASVIGELVSLLYLFITFKISTGYKFKRRHIFNPFTHGKADLIELLQTGLPTTGNSFFRSILRVIQPIVISQSLLKMGMTGSMIAEQFGMLTGYVFPLLFFPGFINHSLSIALVPAISEANASKNKRLVNRRIGQAVRVSLLVGVPSTVILYVFAKPLLTLVYRAPEAAYLLALTAPFFLLQYFHSPLTSALVGLGHATTAMFNNIIPKIISLALIYPFAHLLGLGIYGIALTFCLSVVLETVMHFVALFRYNGHFVNVSEVSKILISGIITAVITKMTFDVLVYLQLSVVLCLTLAIIFCLIFYFTLMLATGTIDWNSITRFGRKP